MRTVSAHELLTTNDCARGGCADAAEPGSLYCRRHGRPDPILRPSLFSASARATLADVEELTAVIEAADPVERAVRAARSVLPEEEPMPDEPDLAARALEEGERAPEEAEPAVDRRDRAAIEEWIRERSAATGYVPTTKEYAVRNGAPTGVNRALAIYGNWGNACEAAGMPRVARGRRIYVGLPNGDHAAMPVSSPSPSLSDLARRLDDAYARIAEARSHLALAEQQALEAANALLAHDALAPYTPAP